MKKISKVLIICFIAILLSGCTEKKALNETMITDKLSNEGFIISDLTNLMEDDDILKVIVANNSKYSIEYYKFEDDKKAKEAYKNNKSMFQNKKENGKEKKDETYEKYTQELSDTYNSLTRVGNTLIYASVNIEYKNDLKKVLKNINY